MAITSNTYTGNGSNKLFSITFPYLEESDVDVYLNGTLQTITTQYSFANATTIEFVTAPSNGTTVKISRSTDDSAVSATFFPGSSIKANDLNANFDQTLYVVQEINNTAVNKTGDTMSGNLDMGGNRITTLGAPTTDTDAANKQYIDSRLGEIGIPGHTRWSKTATAGQTVLSGVGSEGNTLEYSASREQVFVNGALLQRNVDYTANDGLIITMLSPLILGDVVDVRCVNNLPEGIDGLASDITFLQAGTGAVSRSVDSKLKDVVSVKDFGAVGNGVADDTAAINAALALGGRIYFPATANYYRITDDLVMADGTTVEGDGWKSEIRQVTQGKNGFVAGNDCVISRVHVKMPVGNNLDLAKQNAVYISGKKNVLVENNWLELADIAVSGVQMRASFQVTVKGNIIFGGLWSAGAGPNASAADILMYSGAPGGRTIIEGNYCLSNNSQGIFCSALGYDADIVVANNVCVTLDTTTCTQGGTWSEAASGGTRRHGILATYNTAAAGTPRLVIDGNICRNTLWSGIYKQGASSGPVTISNNLCTRNGYANISLSGGIFLYQSGSELVVGNSVDEFQGAAGSGSAGITITSNETTPASATVTCNRIANSLGNGVILVGRSHAVELSHNTFYGNAAADIYQQPIAGIATVAGHNIFGNRIQRASGNTVSGIALDVQATTLVTSVNNNFISGFDNTNNSNTNAGIYTLGQSTVSSIKNNRIQGFYHGIFFGAYQTTNRDAQIEGNEIRDCTNGISIGATTTTVAVPVVDNRFVGILGSRLAAALGGQVGGRLVQRMGQRLQWETTAAPTQGAWEVGDRSVNTTPVVGQPKAWSCTVAGTPGTWVSEGNL